MVYYINVVRRLQNNAALKAPEDISEICRRLGMKCFSMPMFSSQKSKLFQKCWLISVGTFYWMKLNRTLKKGDIIIYQHPMYGNRIAAFFIPRMQRKKHCKFIAVIHDLRTLRKEVTGVFTYNKKTSELSDNVLLKYFDAIVCHNQHMKDYLISKGFTSDKIVNLHIFDYLLNFERQQSSKSEHPSIAIAGNLAIGKCAYIYNIVDKAKGQNLDLTIHLYGDGFEDGQSQENLIYHGSFTPEELPRHLEGDFGLVWDGTSVETCAGNTGKYLKYNNPHKTSLYLASGMPVIVWDQAAIADFILENEVGITVDNLKNLDKVITNISEDDYRSMCEQVKKIGERVRYGTYFTEAIEKCIYIVEKNKNEIEGF